MAMRSGTEAFSPPTWRLTRWLAEPPAGTTDPIRQKLIAEMFGSLPVFFGGLVSTILVPTAVLFVHPTAWFLAWFLIEITVGLSRMAVLVYARNAARRGGATPTNIHLVLALCWSASLGFGVFLSLTSGNWVIATLVCIPAGSMVGGICFRNFAAPRLAAMMMVLSIAPAGLGAVLSGEPIMLCIAALVPMYLFSMTMAAFRLNKMLVSTMTAEQESGYRARHDDLTGLSNRADLKRQMDERFSPAAPQPASFTLLYLDLDGFKAVNDSFGHAAGDRVLQMVADKLNGLVRIGDVTARLGGDEFVVVADDLALEAALELGERLVGKIARTYELETGIRATIGVSIGIACAPQHGADVQTLLVAADRALYAAKALGKGRVAMAEIEAAPTEPLWTPLVPEAGDGERLVRPSRTPA
jgi:diguanylate cyclase (GGDEF)-like protein